MRILLLLVAIYASLLSTAQTRGKIFSASQLKMKDGKWIESRIPVNSKSYICITDGSVVIKTKSKHTYYTYGAPESRQYEDKVSHTWDCKDETGKFCKFIMKIMTIDKVFIISIIYPEDDLVLEYVTN